MKQKYSDEFESESVRLALGSDRPVSQIADKLGVHRKTFYTWVRQAMSDSTSQLNKPDSKKWKLKSNCQSVLKIDQGSASQNDQPLHYILTTNCGF